MALARCHASVPYPLEPGFDGRNPLPEALREVLEAEYPAGISGYEFLAANESADQFPGNLWGEILGRFPGEMSPVPGFRALGDRMQDDSPATSPR